MNEKEKMEDEYPCQKCGHADWRHLGKGLCCVLECDCLGFVSYQAQPVPPAQPAPIPNANPHVIDAAIALLKSRKEIGLATYGTPLQTGNGRDFGRDEDEEAADWFIYRTGRRIEQEERIQGLLRIVAEQSEELRRIKLCRTEIREAKGEFNRFAAEKAKWALDTFGHYASLEPICRHIEKELIEIRQAPWDLFEWCDVVQLAMDGYSRAGGKDLFADLKAKHQINVARKWQKQVGDEPAEHVREGEASA